MEFGACLDLAPAHDVADLREELVPALMREHLAGWPPLDRTTSGHEVAERVVVVRIAGVLRVEVRELGVPGEALRVPLAERCRPHRVARRLVLRQRVRRLQRKARHRLTEFRGGAERTAWRPGRDIIREGALREWAQAILQRQRTGRCVDAPLEQITLGDLTDRQRLDDLGAMPSWICTWCSRCLLCRDGRSSSRGWIAKAERRSRQARCGRRLLAGTMTLEQPKVEHGKFDDAT